LAAFVDDGASGRFQDFLVSPVRRWQLVLGYLTASFIVAVVMSLVILVASQLYLLILGQPVMSASNFASCVGAVVLWAAAFCAFSSLMVTFLHSNGAFGAFSSTFGVLLGFLAGAYMPPGVVPARFANVLNALPFAQAGMLIRVPFTEKALTGLTAGSPAARTEVENVFGMHLAIGSHTVSTGIAVGSLAAMAVVFFVLGILRIRQRIR
jgi:multidrug/hemolysin transport system permease protein